MRNSLPAKFSNRIKRESNISLLYPVCLFILFIMTPIYSFAQEEETPPFELRRQQAGYYGPEAEKPEPTDIEEIVVTYFGPGEVDHPKYGDFWTAIQIAEKNINSNGGISGKPIRVLPVWTEDPWKGGISDMVKTLYEQQIWAMIGSVDSASTHLLAQVAAKVRIPVLSPVSTDKSANLANVPWLFSLLPGDHLLARIMIQEIKTLLAGGKGSFVLVSGTDHDSRLLSTEVKNLLSEEKIVPEYMFEYQPDIPLPWDLVDENTSLFIVIATPEDSAGLVRKIRKRAYKGRIIGGPFMDRNRFAELCGKDGDGIIFVSPGSCSHDSDFALEFHRLTGHDPDYAAGSIYDAVHILSDALKKSGLNRVNLLEEIRNLAGWRGVTGIIEWDPLGQNTRPGNIKTFTSKTSKVSMEE
jgi:branched-chain amino acid transport system substrate-binding protein